MNDLLKEYIIENKKLKKHNEILSEQVFIAKSGLEALVSIGDIAGIPQKTLEEMEKTEKDSLNNDSDLHT